MWLLTDHKYYVALNHIRNLFTLPFEQNRVSIRHSPLDINQELFTLLYESLSTARRTLLSENFTFGLAGAARLLHLHLHHTHVYVLNHLTFAFTCGTCFEITTFGPTTFALATIDVPLDSKLALSSFVQLF